MDKGKEFVFVALVTLALHYSSPNVPRHYFTLIQDGRL